jgi:hypothetical protein
MKQMRITDPPHAARSLLWAVVPVVLCSFSIAHGDTVMSYEFLPNQSIVLQTGGFAGVHIRYPVQGGFQLRTNDGGQAAFQNVDAALGPPAFFQSLEELFNMTGLTGSVIDANTIHFVGQTASGIRGVGIRIDATFQNNLVILTGGFDENDLVWDGFEYEFNAVGRILGAISPGDADGDGDIDKIDFKNLLAQFGGPPTGQSADFNGDGIIDLKDFVILRKHFEFSSAPTPSPDFAATIPEPTTLIVMTLGGLAVMKRRKLLPA